MDALHTTGKLVADSSGLCISAVHPVKNNADGTTPMAFMSGYFGSDTGRHNARRLVACWNAVPDIETEELERIAETGGMLGPRDDVARITAQRDALLAACKTAIPSGVCLTNKNIPDDLVVPVDFTMGDLRKMASAIAQATAVQS